MPCAEEEAAIGAEAKREMLEGMKSAVRTAATAAPAAATAALPMAVPVSGRPFSRGDGPPSSTVPSHLPGLAQSAQRGPGMESSASFAPSGVRRSAPSTPFSRGTTPGLPTKPVQPAAKSVSLQCHIAVVGVRNEDMASLVEFTGREVCRHILPRISAADQRLRFFDMYKTPACEDLRARILASSGDALPQPVLDSFPMGFVRLFNRDGICLREEDVRVAIVFERAKGKQILLVRTFHAEQVAQRVRFSITSYTSRGFFHTSFFAFFPSPC